MPKKLTEKDFEYTYIVKIVKTNFVDEEETIYEMEMTANGTEETEDEIVEGLLSACAADIKLP